MCIIVIAGGEYYCCYYCAAGRPHCFTTQTEWEVNLQPGRVFQARAKAEKQSIRVGGTEMTPSILGSSFAGLAQALFCGSVSPLVRVM